MPNSHDENTRIVGQFLTVCSNLRYCYAGTGSIPHSLDDVFNYFFNGNDIPDEEKALIFRLLRDRLGVECNKDRHL